jgi:hypothetical protein
MADQHWQPGDTVVLRYITTHAGTVGTTWPCRVIADREDLVALYIAAGTMFKQWQPSVSAPDRRLVDTLWQGTDILRLMVPGRGYAVLLVWYVPEREFAGYYVNFEEPFRRTSIGFDTNDHTLDIVVTPDLRWSWKDEGDFDTRVHQGIYSVEFADAVRADAEVVISTIERRQPPFSGEWEAWSPDPAWSCPPLPPEWDREPVALWERRRWAYPSAV